MNYKIIAKDMKNKAILVKSPLKEYYWVYEDSVKDEENLSRVINRSTPINIDVILDILVRGRVLEGHAVHLFNDPDEERDDEYSSNAEDNPFSHIGDGENC